MHLLLCLHLLHRHRMLLGRLLLLPRLLLLLLGMPLALRLHLLLLLLLLLHLRLGLLLSLLLGLCGLLSLHLLLMLQLHLVLLLLKRVRVGLSMRVKVLGMLRMGHLAHMARMLDLVGVRVGLTGDRLTRHDGPVRCHHRSALMINHGRSIPLRQPILSLSAIFYLPS